MLIEANAAGRCRTAIRLRPHSVEPSLHIAGRIGREAQTAVGRTSLEILNNWAASRARGE